MFVVCVVKTSLVPEKCQCGFFFFFFLFIPTGCGHKKSCVICYSYFIVRESSFIFSIKNGGLIVIKMFWESLPEVCNFSVETRV